uniref:Innexin n=1 Tax=Strongyloides venezuelensis TaxID=75913 RepID=A0A0K0FA43_STRVS
MMIESLVGMIKYLSPREDDDWSDRMNYLHTPNILLAFSVLISFKQFGGRPIECMFPNKFPGSWEQYAENYCWSQDTYYVQPHEHVANIDEKDRYSQDRKLSYYQWVPFFLLFQAACFRFPSVFWKYISLNSGIRVHEIVERAMDPSNLENKTKDKNLEVLTQHISAALRFQKKIAKKNIIIHKTMKILNISYSACFISYMYLIMKSLYMINVIVQLYILNKFLETDKYQWYGFGVIKDIMLGTQWERSGFFPRVSLCDFTVRQVANIQKYSVQCVLVINIFNEKIFVLLWFWYVLLSVATLSSFIYWILIMTFSCFGRGFISSNLELSDLEDFDPERCKKNVRRFVNEYLKQDGIFVLRMISTHAGIIFGTELVARLYSVFMELEEDRKNEFNKMIEDRVISTLRKRKDNTKGSNISLCSVDQYSGLIDNSDDKERPDTANSSGTRKSIKSQGSQTTKHYNSKTSFEFSDKSVETAKIE